MSRVAIFTKLQKERRSQD